METSAIWHGGYATQSESWYATPSFYIYPWSVTNIPSSIGPLQHVEERCHNSNWGENIKHRTIFYDPFLPSRIPAAYAYEMRATTATWLLYLFLTLDCSWSLCFIIASLTYFFLLCSDVNFCFLIQPKEEKRSIRKRSKIRKGYKDYDDA